MDRRELYHWGIKGQKWGQRRYQNKDGSLTPAGKKRYSKQAEDISSMSDQELRSKINRMNLEKRYINLSKNQNSRGNRALDNTAKAAGVGTDTGRIVKSGYEIKGRSSTKVDIADKGLNVVANTARGAKKISNIAEDKRAAKKAKTKLESMSDKDLQDVVNRMDLEQQYSNLRRETVNRGRVSASEVLDIVGSVVSIGASASAMAVSLYVLKKKVGQ